MLSIAGSVRKLFNKPVSRRFEYNWILKRVPSGSEVFDVGCVRGGRLQDLTKQLLKKDCAVTGISLEQVTFKQKNFRFIHGDVTDYLPPCKFDVVVASHVLQHLGLPYWREHEKFNPLADAEFIEHASDWLKPNGKLFLIVPLAEKPQLLNYSTDCHYRVYSMESLQKLVNSRFQIVECIIFDGAHNTKRIVASAKAIIMELTKK
jgi:SAM-dependent methyltransferase